MTSTRKVDPPRGSESPQHEPARGIVEEIREELSQAVETVPTPVRWTVRKLLLLIGLSLLAMVVILIVSGILYFAKRTELVAKELTLFVNSTLARRTDLALDVADVRGNPFREIRLIRPRVRFRDGNAPVLLEAPSARLRYSTWGLLSSRGRFVEIDLESPVIRLGQLPDGHIRLPVWKSAGPSPGAGRGFDVRLRIHRGTMHAPRPLEGIEGLELDASVAAGKATRVQVRALGWKQGFFRTRDLKLTGELSAGDSVQFVVHQLRSADLDLTARGGWLKGTSERVVHADVQRLRWRWLAEATGNRTFDVPGQGELSLDARGESAWAGRFNTRLTWGDLPIQGGGGFGWDGHRLTVQPLHGESPAGRLDGKLAWSKQGWEIGGEARDANPARWQAIGITGWPEGVLNGEFRYAVDTRRKPFARLEATLAGSEIAHWVADRAQVTVSFPPQGPDSFSVLMWRRGGEARLDGQSGKSGWRGHYVLTRLPLEEWPDGRASGIRGVLEHAEGTVAGQGGDLQVTGTLSGMATDWLGAHMARWRLADVAGLLLPKPDLTAAATLEDMTFLAIHFDTTAMSLHLRDQAVDLASVAARAGDTLVTLAGHAAWSEAGWRLALDRAEARSTQFHWVSEPPVVLAGDRQGVVFDRLRARDGGATLAVEGRWAAPGGSYDWKMETRSLDLSRIGMPPEWQLAGLADVALEVRGVSDAPHWTLAGTCSKPSWQGHRADSLNVTLAGSPATLDLRDLTFHLEGGVIRAHTKFEEAQAAWPDTLSADGVQRWLKSAARWQGAVSADRLPLDHLDRLAPAAKGWTGQVSGELSLAGSPKHPELVASAEAKPLAWEAYLVDEAKADVRYGNDRLEVTELRMTRGDLVSTAVGAMPLKLELGARPEFPEAPMSWRVEIPNGDLSVLPLFVPQFGTASGRFELSVGIEGTPRHPELDGTFGVRDAELRMAGREEVLDHVNADVRLDESHVRLDSLSARQGERGRVRASGVAELSGAGLKGYSFDLKMREFTAVETGLYAAQFDGDFTVTNGPRVNGQVLPLVVGRADIRRAVILFDFANQSELQKIAATTQPLFWTYRIQVNANNNLHWQPPDGDIEFNANLSLEQTPDQLVIYGEMHAIRGTYYFLSNRFTINKADLGFDNVGGVNPVIDVEAVTRVQPSRLPSGDATSAGTVEVHEITVRITGRANEPVIEFASKPNDWDEASILRELTLGQFVGAGGLGDPLDNYLTRAINKTLSAEMSRVFRGYVNQWQLEREHGGIGAGQGDLVLSVGSQITPNIQIIYRQRVPGLGRETASTIVSKDPFERDVEAEFRLNRFFYITSEVTQRRTLGGSAGTSSGAPDFNVNLKARWEY